MSERGARGFRDGDEFDRAERSDEELDRAADRELRESDWEDLHGESWEGPTMDEAIAQWGRDRKEASR